MALIQADELNKVEKTRNLVHKKTVSTYTVFYEDQNKYFQIDTYGSSDRVMTEKVSQSIQFNRETAIKIIDILKKELSID